MNKRKRRQNRAGPKKSSGQEALRLYRSLHDQYHADLRRERFGRTHTTYGFPLLLRHNVCVADPDLGHAPGIIIDNLPKDLFQKDVLDVGCGSGVISLAAAYRGANVVATDIDPKALRLTEENLALNAPAAKRIIVMKSDLFRDLKRTMPDKKFDIVAANLWFPVEDPNSRHALKEALTCYRDFFRAARSFLKPGGVVCLPINDFADTDSTMQIMQDNGIRPYIAHAYKKHFGGQVGVNWRLYSFDRDGNPARLNAKPSLQSASSAP